MSVVVFMLLLLLGFGAFPFWTTVFPLSELYFSSNRLYSSIKYTLKALMVWFCEVYLASVILMETVFLYCIIDIKVLKKSMNLIAP
ncbi:hypothetical protein Syun_007210 [Stephania yunnanensis]|uniref:Uncharacterized protein n=1 Tax=Stephania yunnanensis TaxID=152371 RepID=A0AAP0Q034_9MAGN